MIEFASSTYTYILGCSATRKAVIIDPVLETAHRDAQIIRELDLDLMYGLNTHVHADHVTGTAVLKTVRLAKLSSSKFKIPESLVPQAFPSMKSVLAASSGGKADLHVKEGDKIKFGHEHLDVLATPGHTDGCISYVSHAHRMVFTGDALLIRGCGRTDFQQGNPRTLYRSISDKIFTLPDDYLVYVGHNYEGILQSSVGEEKKYNPRLTKSEEDFVKIMKELNLDYPKQIVQYGKNNEAH
ncbi:metallo-beta-lactamase domain protein [Ancylostoma duodenale]|uniref:Metallo-beta-lactamase domain protein n=1 Tax=Ancylostoma duodenale TaxID=51022 RepID=A0A0C2GDI2_9BILA|nr:metallo-beta-lactamase domain protein [Ancylostoma duodenale]